MTGNELAALSIADLQSLLRAREISPREVIDALRKRIEAVDPDIGAYLSFDIEAATKEAEHANVNLPLGGIPIAIKTQLRTGFAIRPGRFCFVPRPSWADNENRPRRCANHERYRRS